MSTPENKSYLSAGINALSPWGSRSATPKPPGLESDEAAPESTGMGTQRGGDHTVNYRHRLSLKSYPRDCPPLFVQWFHAIDAPKRKPLPSGAPISSSDKPTPRPKKWVPFSPSDSRAIETTFQKVADEADAKEKRLEIPGSPRYAYREKAGSNTEHLTKVPVNEDYLFDVEIETRELAPAYWLGPVYDVRRGTWFYQNGTPCDENLATQLEEGYLKTKPWRFAPQEKRAASQPRSRPTSINVKGTDDLRKTPSLSKSNPITPKTSSENLKSAVESGSTLGPCIKPIEQSPQDGQNRTHRLFGAHMNSVVTYEDATTAWQLTDDLYSRMGSTVYQRFAGGAHFFGEKLTRGYIDPLKRKDDGKDGRPGTSESTSSNEGNKDDNDSKPVLNTADSPSHAENDEPVQSPSEARRKTLERHLSSLVTSTQPEDPAEQEEESRKRDEKEIRDDYKDQTSDEQGREIEHLLLVTHGIGQRLGMRMESVNFVHDVNTLRKSLKAIYANSADLQALNSEVDKDIKNCRIQVLPICWRHLLDFPKQSLKHNRKEHDLGDIDAEDDEYPNLDDITVEGVPAVRNLITDLALDILLYQSPAYKGHISRIVLQECNRIYRLFKERNPAFDGKVSLVGHSLGSAVMFDILCQQRDAKMKPDRNKQRRATEESMRLDFEVEDFYALGSPIGLFQMLKGRTIAGRPASNFVPPETPADSLEDPFTPLTLKNTDRAFEITVSSPKCAQIFNIFHPTDPISYRIEPLISSAMATLKPQPLPYTKKGIFGAPVGQGLTGIGARVGQSVSGFWTQISSGIASGILNRSLGISGADATKLSSDLGGQSTGKSSRPLSVGAGTNLGGGVVAPSNEPGPASHNDDRRRRLGEEPIAAGEIGEHPPTLLDSEIETLYAGFQKRRKSRGSDSGAEGGKGRVEKDLEWQNLEERSRKLRKEEGKVRALNSNGRVDYSIQEGAFDISLIASIASHLAYWQDEDVSHFMISQLLARHRVFKTSEAPLEEVNDRV